MKSQLLVAASALVLIAASPAVSAVQAQAPCSTSAVVIDSARTDAVAVLGSGSPLVSEMLQEQRLTPASLASISVVKERFVCARLAGTFDHFVAPGMSFVVLKVGPLYYARDPDQRRGTGILTDSTFKVLLRFGAALPAGKP